MFRKIVDITFWVSFISTVMHFYIWTLVVGTEETEFTKDVINMTFFSGGIAILSYFASKPPKNDVNSDNENNY
jgi:hypothetical protein